MSVRNCLNKLLKSRNKTFNVRPLTLMTFSKNKYCSFNDGTTYPLEIINNEKKKNQTKKLVPKLNRSSWWWSIYV